MKIAIINPMTNHALDGKTIRSLELFAIKKFLQRKFGAEVFFVCQKIRKYSQMKDVIDYNDCNLNDFDALALYTSPLQLFGGYVKPHTLKIVKELANYKKKVYAFYTDPLIKVYSYAKYFYDRQQKGKINYFDYNDRIEITLDDVESEKNIDFVLCSDANDIGKYYGETKKANVVSMIDVEYLQTNIFHLITQDNQKYFLYSEEDTKDCDLIYYGNNRCNHRNKRIQYYFKANCKKRLIGVTGLKDIEADRIKNLPIKETAKEVNKSKFSLVIGDKEHEGNVKTPRFYENMMSNSLAIVDISYDPKKEYMKDSLLKKYCYVSSPDEIEMLLEIFKDNWALYDTLVKKQQYEVMS